MWAGSATARLRAALDEVLHPLDTALGLRIGRLAEVPVDAQLPAEGGELVGRPAIAGVQAGLTVPDQRLGQRAERPQATPDAGQQIRRLPGEDQRAGTGARVGQARDNDPRPASLAVTDRHLRARLPQIELADLPRPIDRPLKTLGGGRNTGRISRR